MQSVKLQPRSTSIRRSKKKLSVIGGQSKSVQKERAEISIYYKNKAKVREFESEHELADWLAAGVEGNQ